MGFKIQQPQMEQLFQMWMQDYFIYAPKRFPGGGSFSDTDCIRYGEVQTIGDVIFNEKSQYSFKEVLLPISQTLFFFTEDEIKEPTPPKKGALIFLRSCDIHALKRLDDMYLHNGSVDHYYQQLRNKLKVILIDCKASFENCFCSSMGTNKTDEYDLSFRLEKDYYLLDCKDAQWAGLLQGMKDEEVEVLPAYVTENKVNVQIPKNLSSTVSTSKMWDTYDERCINCGRCNFVCPTCTCFTMQDLFYSENGRVGERRRVLASCMVDGFTDVAGGGSYRQKNGQRMRFKVLHKVLDYKQRNGYHMCVGCGRCDDICPEYISFSNCINQLEGAMKEVSE